MNRTYTPPQFSQALNRLAKKARGDVLGQVAMAGGQVIEAQAKINVISTFKNVTGALGGSIQTTLESATPNQAVVAVGPTAIYGRIQELGGVVKPLKAKKLHWVDENGRPHSAFSVTLPPRPYMRPAAEDHLPDINQAMMVNLQMLIEAMI